MVSLKFAFYEMFLAKLELRWPRMGFLASHFTGRVTQKRKARIAEVLATLAATAAVREVDGAYFLPR